MELPSATGADAFAIGRRHPLHVLVHLGQAGQNFPIGVYGTMTLRKSRLARQESVQVDQAHGSNSVELAIKTRLFAFAHGEVELEHSIDGQVIANKVSVQKGENVFTYNVTIHNPKLWWPAGQGAARRSTPGCSCTWPADRPGSPVWP